VQTLEEESPDLEIRIDGGSGFRMAMFVIGLLGGLAGLFFALAGALDWVKRGHLLAIGGGLVFAGLLFALARAYAPWRPVETLSPKELGVLFASI